MTIGSRTQVRAYKPSDKCHWACTPKSSADYRVMTIGSRTQVRAYKPSDKCHWACTPKSSADYRVMTIGPRTQVRAYKPSDKCHWACTPKSSVDYRVMTIGSRTQVRAHKPSDKRHWACAPKSLVDKANYKGRQYGDLVVNHTLGPERTLGRMFQRNVETQGWFRGGPNILGSRVSTSGIASLMRQASSKLFQRQYQGIRPYQKSIRAIS